MGGLGPGVVGGSPSGIRVALWDRNNRSQPRVAVWASQDLQAAYSLQPRGLSAAVGAVEADAIHRNVP